MFTPVSQKGSVRMVTTYAKFEIWGGRDYRLSSFVTGLNILIELTTN